MGTNVGASQNTVRKIFIAALGAGFVTPMATAVITNTPVRNGIRIGSTTTTTGSDKPKNPRDGEGPAGRGALSRGQPRLESTSERIFERTSHDIHRQALAAQRRCIGRFLLGKPKAVFKRALGDYPQ